MLPGIMQAGSCDLLQDHPRVMMVSHAAATTPTGALSVEWFRASGCGNLVGVMGPEHGFLGHAAAGVSCRTFQHPFWQVPVYSLYGQNRSPKASWLHKADVLLVDLQDLGYRPYTYVSTLFLALKAAAKCQMPVVVADRPIPLPHVVEGPMLDPSFESFVGLVPVPFCYGMTPGETARWIQKQLLPDLQLSVLPVQGFRRSQGGQQYDWPWVSPSPSIRCAETAVVYPATVAFEGLPHVDHGRYTTMPFQLIGAPWFDPERLVQLLMERNLPGVRFHPHLYVPMPGKKTVPGIRITVLDARVFRPMVVMLHVLDVITHCYGIRRVWQNRHARPAFFDQLMGTDRVRKGLLAGESPNAIMQAWDHDMYLQQRKDVLLYI